MKNHLTKINDTLSNVDLKPVEDFVKLLKLCNGFKSNIFVAGNGGSFCDALHFGQDAISYVLNNGGKPLKTHVLACNPGVSSALSNDFSYEKSLVKELKIYASKNKGDILVLFSGSGNSKNLIEAATWAKLNGVAVVSFVGFSGGVLRDISDICIYVPSENWGIVHGCQSLLFHHILDCYLK